MMDTNQEDEILKAANEIKHKAYADAEAKWKETPDNEKKRPWPRCGNLTCNRTLTCVKEHCEGFDF